MPRILKQTNEAHLKSYIGGSPTGPKDMTWPICGACSLPMRFLAKIDLSECGVPELALRQQDLLLFQCENDPGCCESWEPGSSANAAMLVPYSDEPIAIPIPKKGETVFSYRVHLDAVDYSEGVDEQETWEAYIEQKALIGDDELVGRLGGKVLWVQPVYNSMLKCSCGQEMLNVLWLHELPEMNFGGGGTAYGLVCPGCTDSAMFLTQN